MLSIYSEVYLSSLTSVQTAVECVCSEMGSMCRDYSWLNEVWDFITHWEGKKKAVNMTADEYEVCVHSSVLYFIMSMFWSSLIHLSQIG